MDSHELEIISELDQALILVVDDDADTRCMLRHTLAALGHEIVEADDGGKALERCKEQLPDLVITDVMMPNMTGTEFVQQFRDEFKECFVPVLMLTALGEVEEKVEGLDAGADDYLTKPFNFNELIARVRALLRIKILTEQLYTRTVELMRANEELSRMQEELIKKERELVAMQFAGAAAHNLGQPITSILLNCRILERGVAGSANAEAGSAVAAIKQECLSVKQILAKLKAVNAHSTESYVGGTTILDLESSAEKEQ